MMTTVSDEYSHARSAGGAAGLVVLASAWDDPYAVALRAAMDAEIAPRYAERLAVRPEPAEMAVDPRDLVYAGLAYAGGRAAPRTPSAPCPIPLPGCKVISRQRANQLRNA